MAGGIAGRNGLRCLTAARDVDASAPDLKALHAQIGERTLEDDFLEGALIMADMLSRRK
jgi:hypothetical protein